MIWFPHRAQHLGSSLVHSAPNSYFWITRRYRAVRFFFPSRGFASNMRERAPITSSRKKSSLTSLSHSFFISLSRVHHVLPRSLEISLAIRVFTRRTPSWGLSCWYFPRFRTNRSPATDCLRQNAWGFLPTLISGVIVKRASGSKVARTLGHSRSIRDGSSFAPV